ncbi:glycosyl hydrolases family 18-domain-containing protein [Truncatella angustata]|uniref:chitinase n=1 Tax=Truncatella angustata TaxID=152316 RepID=A0A9P8UWX2_9PEZI|nr:glycosyl hydrolases family 18-domain-containing protein [Truncatella angustata]KAH6659459.1 glycosyl hydrolases family 18-domain-containing protein [Truncatella angustata]
MSIPPTTSPTLIPIPSLASTLTLSNSLVSTSSIISTSNLHSPTSAVLSIISTIIPTNPNPATTLSATSLNVPLSPTIISSSTPTTILSPATTASLSSSRTQNGFINAAYFINWGINDRNYYPNQLPAADLTHVFYAFATQLPNGTVISSEPEKDAICIRQLKVLKQNNPSLKVILSIGGWDASQDGSFSTLASTDARRYVFASSAVHMMQAYGFDGIDINWEYPANNRDGANFVLLLKEVRSALDILGNQYNRHHFLLTVAAPAEPAHYRYWRVSDMVQYLDFFNFMGYDYMGAGLSTMSGHQANLYKSSKIPSSTAFETESGVDFYIASGVPPFKIVLGMPLYGRSFENTELGGSFTAPITGSWPDSSGGTNGGGAGVWDYKVLPKAGATEIYAIDAGATYSYDADTRELISYDTVDQVRRKIDYVLSMGLAGAYFWEASADRTGEGSLILTSATRFREAGSLDSTANIVL